MTVRLELKPETEASLSKQAAERGVPLETYIQNLVDDLARADRPSKVDPDEFRQTLDRLADMGRHLPPLPSAALTRESIYQDHD